MFKIIEKLENYYILRCQKEFAIIGTKIVFQQYKKFNTSVMQPKSAPVSKAFPIFFMVTVSKKISSREAEFRAEKLPILNLANNKNIFSNEDEIKEALDKFINERCEA